MDISELSYKYNTLLKKSLLNEFYPENELDIQHLQKEVQKFSLLRLDGDLYESTMDALVALYDKLSAGGGYYY